MVLNVGECMVSRCGGLNESGKSKSISLNDKVCMHGNILFFYLSGRSETPHRFTQYVSLIIQDIL